MGDAGLDEPVEAVVTAARLRIDVVAQAMMDYAGTSLATLTASVRTASPQGGTPGHDVGPMLESSLSIMRRRMHTNFDLIPHATEDGGVMTLAHGTMDVGKAIVLISAAVIDGETIPPTIVITGATLPETTCAIAGGRRLGEIMDLPEGLETLCDALVLDVQSGDAEFMKDRVVTIGLAPAWTVHEVTLPDTDAKAGGSSGR